jgi:lipopolysaccharide transport system permease protein
MDKTKIPIRVYSAESEKENFFIALWDTLKMMPQANSLGYRLASRNIKAKYRQSLLGFSWAVFPPLITALVWIILNDQKVVSFESFGVPYSVFVFTGTMLWQIFSFSVTVPLQSMKTNKSILVKINFPREAIFISALYEVGFSAIISLGLLTLILIYFGVVPGIYFGLFFLGIMVLMLFGLMFSLLLMPIALLYRDISLGIPIVLQFALYLTPVIYPQPLFGGLGKLLYLNPVSPILTNSRIWLLGLQQEVAWKPFIILSIVVFILVILGMVLQRKTLNILIERLGS